MEGIRANGDAYARVGCCGRRRTTGALIAWLLLGACLPADDPRKFPMRVVAEGFNPHTADQWALDVDGDGRDEIVEVVARPQPRIEPGPMASLLFSDHDLRPIDQTNYDGLPGVPQALDITGDSVAEFLIPLLRNDSLFMSVTSAQGRKVDSFLLTTGRPRIEPDGLLPWDPQVLQSWVIDLGDDGRRKLVTAISTAFARLPRGVLVHALPEGTLLGEAIVGAPPAARLLDDFDEDGEPELLVATQRTLHGTSAGGLDDSHCYLVLFELSPMPTVAWSRELEAPGCLPRLARAAEDEDDLVLLALGGGPLTVFLIETDRWEIRMRRELPGSFTTPLLIDLDHDRRLEIVATSSTAPGVVVVDDDLTAVQRAEPPMLLGYGSVLPDADADGMEELVFPAGGGFALLAPSLAIKALFPRGEATGVQRNGNGPARILIREGDTTALAIIEPNPWFLVYRFGPGVGIALALPLGGILAVQLRRTSYRLRLIQAAGVKALEASGRGLLVMDAGGTIVWEGAALRRGPPPSRWSVRRTLRSIQSLAPDLARFCAELPVAAPIGPRSTRLSSPTPSGGTHVTAEPILIGSSQDPHWLVRIEPEKLSDSASTWPLMVQRAMHGLKNPLTHMLLTIQRLQAEYRERAPAVSGRLDPYAERIQEGIAQLRRLTSSFLKLVDVESSDMSETDLNAVVSAFCERFRAQMPPDIRLRFDPAPSLPSLLADGEQLEVALDNLLTNAVNALGSGGNITVSTSLARGVAKEDGGTGTVGDDIVLEVMDTGIGVAEPDVDRIFDVGYSTSPGGSGIGLAIVRKIVADHGGSISVHSEVGVGTALQIHLPLPTPSPHQR